MSPSTGDCGAGADGVVSTVASAVSGEVLSTLMMSLDTSVASALSIEMFVVSTVLLEPAEESSIPAISVPGGFYANGLPFGLEISGVRWHDGDLIG